MEQTQQTSIEEKQAYCERIEKKAKDENITIKYAAQKLGYKIWSYYKYKADIRKMERTTGHGNTGDKPKIPAVETTSPAQITLTVSPDVMCYLEKEAEGYATSADIVAQLLLHDCVRGKIKQQPAKVDQG